MLEGIGRGVLPLGGPHPFLGGAVAPGGLARRVLDVAGTLRSVARPGLGSMFAHGTTVPVGNRVRARYPQARGKG